MSKRLATIMGVSALALVAFATSSIPAQAEFGLNGFDVTFENKNGSPATKAGSHPFAMETTFHVNAHQQGGVFAVDQELKDLKVQLPVGFAGNPSAMPRCSHADFLKLNSESTPACPNDTAVGTVTPAISTGPNPTNVGFGAPRAIFNLKPPPGVAAELGFVAARLPVTVDVSVTRKAPYSISAASLNAPQAAQVFALKLTLWGNPANPAHDEQRGSCIVKTGVKCSAEGAPEKPFLTLPRACDAPTKATFTAVSWQEPDATPVSGEAETAFELSECEELGFAPTITAEPTEHAAETPAGLEFNLDVADPGLTEPEGTADADIKKSVVTLPAGFTTNSAVASGLGACTLAQYEAEELQGEGGCPESSKVGSVEIETPLLENDEEEGGLKVLHGQIYVAKQHDNVFDNLLTIYMVIEDPALGILIKLPGKVEPDPATGQLTTTFDELPRVPFSHFHLHFREGKRAPLVTPPTCGTYTTEAELYSYSKPTVSLHRSASFEITSGTGGAPCASQLSNSPSFSAGTLSPLAGSYSPFVLKLSRADGSQQFSAVSTTLPQGLLGKLAGIPYCSDAQIAQAQSRSGEGQGALELASASCPPASEVGIVTVGAGAGPEPLYVTGHAYLAGPYKGAPLSLEIVTPAIAGPFDLGVVAVRIALQVNPETAQITAVSDPIPTILHGLPLDVRSDAIDMSRPQFTLNPTSCEPKTILGTSTSTLGLVAPLSSYFQASACAGLGFGPNLALSLQGGMKRTKHPALKAVVTYPKKGSYANIKSVRTVLPRGLFIDNARVANPCTRPQFAENACPAKSVLGKARAYSPLLDKPLEGNVYFRSNGGERNLPDLVADLNGQIHVVLVGFVDAAHKKGSEVSRVRTTFASAPDAPVSKFVLELFGGKKGLLVNSTNLCKADNRAQVKMTAQNGKRLSLEPTIGTSCKGPKPHGRR
jgi:hypothetical protein